MLVAGGPVSFRVNSDLYEYHILYDWHWFAERDELNEFEMPKELKAKINATQKKQKRESRQDRNATKRKAIEADVFFVPATFGDVQHLIKVGAALDVRSRATRVRQARARRQAHKGPPRHSDRNPVRPRARGQADDMGIVVAERTQAPAAAPRRRHATSSACSVCWRPGWDDLGWPTHDKRFKAAQPREDLELDDADLDKWRRTLTEQPEPWDPQPPPRHPSGLASNLELGLRA